MAGLRYHKRSFADLTGWADDDHQAALDVFGITRGALGPDWPELPRAGVDARLYFEANFTPVLIVDDRATLFTGYYEPELAGAPVKDAHFRYPAYAVPPDLDPGTPYLTRAEIEGGALQGRGLELAWFADPVDVFFLQVQGSGRVRFPDGGMLRLGFAAKNGHPYTSVGAVLVERGAVAADAVSPEAIRAYVRSHGPAILCENASFVFFRPIDAVPATDGPLGALGQSVTAGRTLAVDPDVQPLGAPVWIEKAGAVRLCRLMVAQDTGSAIKGAQRADIFFGTGAKAGQAAGAVKDGGRMVTLLPHVLADRLCKGAADA
ncbi:murein transglycosylase A [Yoonia sp.]|uniref:murein transglycosylase A n=1 Tax=Yoonia sp. TaxID=2212373 RepID=UPI003FCEB55F